jgi:hypothetical protein
MRTRREWRRLPAQTIRLAPWIDDHHPAPGASLLANDEIYLDMENVRLGTQNSFLEIENAGFENDAAIRSYLDPVIHEGAVLTIEASVAGIEAEVFDVAVKVLDPQADVPDTEAAGLNAEADVAIRVVAAVICEAAAVLREANANGSPADLFNSR